MIAHDSPPFLRSRPCQGCHRPTPALIQPSLAPAGALCDRCRFDRATPRNCVGYTRTVPRGRLDLGAILSSRLAVDLFGRDRIGGSLARHARGDFGQVGRLDDPPSAEADAMDPGMLRLVGSAADRNGLALATDRGIVRSRFGPVDLGRRAEVLAVATLLDEASGPRTVVCVATCGEPGP